MTKLVYSPTQESYTVTRGEELLVVDYGGGATAARRLPPGAPAIITVSWVLSALGFSYMMAFYRSASGHGALPFTIDLETEESDLVEATARFVPGSLRLAAKQGDAFLVESQLEVEMPPPDDEADEALMHSYSP